MLLRMLGHYMQSNWQPWSLSVGFLLKLAAKLLKTIRYAVCLHEMGHPTAIKREFTTLQSTVSLSIHNVSTHSHPDITILVDWAQKSYWLTGHENVTGWLGTKKLLVDWARKCYLLTGHKQSYLLSYSIHSLSNPQCPNPQSETLATMPPHPSLTLPLPSEHGTLAKHFP